MGAQKLTYYDHTRDLEQNPYSFLRVLEKSTPNSKNRLKTYKYRMHDPRIGRFFAVDPLAAEYSHNSPYAFSENRVIDGIELEGREWITYRVIYDVVGGKKVVLSKAVMADYRNASEEQMNKMHGTSNFYSQYSQGFGPKGAGVLYEYYQVNDDGEVNNYGKDVWEVRPGAFRHGFYYGRGSITKNGKEITPRGYGNYDFSVAPLDMTDAIAKSHDEMQHVSPYAGPMSLNYLTSDVILLARVSKFLKNAKDDPNYVDPFTGRTVSAEAIDAAEWMQEIFSNIVQLKKNQLKSMYKDGSLTKDEYKTWKNVIQVSRAYGHSVDVKPEESDN